MSDHNFEKQVQQKLEELKIPPADKVWSSVEAQIRKDKRRRRGLIFFPLFLLLFGGGYYFIIQNFSSTNNSVSKSTSTKSKPQNNIATINENQHEVPSNKEPVADDLISAKPQPIPNNRSEERAVNLNHSENEDSQKLSLTKPIVSRDATRKQTPASKNDEENGAVVIAKSKERRDVKKYPTAGNHRPQKVIRNNDLGKQNSTEQHKNIPSGLRPTEEKVSPHDQKNKVDEPSANQVASMLNNHQSDSTKIPADSIQTAIVDTASVVATVEQVKSTAKKLRSSMKWGASGSLGVSNLSDGGFFDGIFDGILGVEKAMVADVSPAPNTQSNAGPTAVFYKPSEIQKGFSFALGAFVQKNITKKISISTGLQYRFYSTHIRVGNRIDSFAMVQNAFGSMNISQYYRAAPVPTTQKYTNRFHFVELPVTGHLQLNKGNRLPISWNAGLSLSYLVSTNVLHFDSRTGLYYKDNDLLNRLQVGMSTGFAFTLLNASKLSVQLGPQLQYNFTDLMKSKVADNKHLFYFGLNSKFFLKK